MWKVCWNKGRLYWKITKLFHFSHLKKLVRPENFGHYHVTILERSDSQSVSCGSQGILGYITILTAFSFTYFLINK
jgi:hypothetical protein